MGLSRMPMARNRRDGSTVDPVLVGRDNHPGDYVIFNSYHPSDATSDIGP